MRNTLFNPCCITASLVGCIGAVGVACVVLYRKKHHC